MRNKISPLIGRITNKALLIGALALGSLFPNYSLSSEEANKSKDVDANKPKIVNVAGKPFKVLNRNPNSDVDIYLITNTHVREDIKRDFELVERLSNNGKIKGLIMEGTKAAENDAPLPLTRYIDFLKGNGEENSPKASLLETLDQNKTNFYGGEDPKLLKNAIKSTYEEKAIEYFRLYGKIERATEHVGNELGDPLIKTTSESFRNSFLRQYGEVKERLDMLLEKEVTEEEIRENIEDPERGTEAEARRVFKRSVVERNMQAAKITKELVSRGEEDLAVFIGNSHLKGQATILKREGYNLYVPDQKPISKEIIDQAVRTGNNYMPKDLAYIYKCIGDLGEFAEKLKTEAKESLRRKSVKIMKDALQKFREKTKAYE